MNALRLAPTSACLLALLLAACSTPPVREPAPAPAPAPTAAPVSAFEKALDQGRITIAPQPTEADLRALKARGYTRIVNVRTQAEMEDRKQVPFDEVALAAELEIDYVHLPIGGDTPFRPEVIEGLERALAADGGRVFLHCTSGNRASLVHAAYAVKHLGADPDEAMRATAHFGAWPLPLERLTGVKLKVVRAEE